MKLLLDENLSPRILARLPSEFGGSLHVRAAGLMGRDDGDIWDHAAGHGFFASGRATG